MTDSKYLVIDRVENEVEELPINDTVERVKRLEKENLVVGYDIHAGFNIPSNIEFRELFAKLNLDIAVDLAVIDERRQSGHKPYSPISVYVVEDGVTKRKSIYKHRHVFVSEIPLNKSKILEAYQRLLGDEYTKYANLLEKAGGKSVGDFLTQLTQFVLKESLAEFEHVSFRGTRFDKILGATEASHPVTYHEGHDILYIGQHKAAYDTGILNYLVERFNSLGEKPYFIIIPINPEPYFKIK